MRRDLGDACIGTHVIELAGDLLPSRLRDAWQRAHIISNGRSKLMVGHTMIARSQLFLVLFQDPGEISLDGLTHTAAGAPSWTAAALSLDHSAPATVTQ